jgi:hypothetical protein
MEELRPSKKRKRKKKMLKKKKKKKVGANGILVGNAFRNDASLTRVVLPEGVLGIADGDWDGGAFSGCTNLVRWCCPSRAPPSGNVPSPSAPAWPPSPPPSPPSGRVPSNGAGA